MYKKLYFMPEKTYRMDVEHIICQSLFSIVDEAIRSNARKIIIKLSKDLSFFSVEDNGDWFDKLNFRFLKNREVLINKLVPIYETIEFLYKSKSNLIIRSFECGEEKDGTVELVKDHNQDLGAIVKIYGLLEVLRLNKSDKSVHYVVLFLNEIAYLNMMVAFDVYLDEELILCSEKYKSFGLINIYKPIKSLELTPFYFIHQNCEFFCFMSNKSNVGIQNVCINNVQASNSNVHLYLNKILDSLLEKERGTDCECLVHNKDSKSCENIDYSITVVCPSNCVTLDGLNEKCISFKTDNTFLNALWELANKYTTRIHEGYKKSLQINLKDSINYAPSELVMPSSHQKENTFLFSVNFNNYARANLNNCFSNIPQELMENTPPCQNDVLDESFFDNNFVDIDKQIEQINQRFMNQGIVFTKDFFQHIQIVGQVGNKFIAALYYIVSNNDSISYIILFDQHAVDERIHLESLIKAETFGKGDFYTTKLDQPFMLDVTQEELRALNLLPIRLKKIGFLYKTDETNLTLCIFSMPSILCKLLKPNIFNRMREVIFDVIKLEIDFLLSNGQPSFTFPIFYHKLLCQESCKRAIKFGQSLSRNQIENLLKNLSQCRAPFQCAHGRPVLNVICKYKKEEYKVQPPSFSKIVHSRKKSTYKILFR